MLAGLPEVEQPKLLEVLRLPDDMAALDSVSLSRLLGRYTQAYGYAATQRAKADLAIIKLEAAMQARRTVLCSANPALVSHMEKHRRDLALSNDELIARSLQEIAQHRQTREWAACLAGVYDKSAAAVSRELTRKMSISGPDYTDVGKFKRR